MTLLYVLSDTLLYGCLAWLIGHFAVQLIPLPYRPDVSFSVRQLRLFILLIPVLFSSSVIRIVRYLYEDIGFWMTLRSVLLTFEVGNAWIVMSILSILLSAVTFSKRQQRISLSLSLLFFMVVTLAWAGHASSIKGAEGIVVHTVHALSVFIWVGGLFVLGFSSKTEHNWQLFIEWFKPLVTLCFVLIVGSGIYLMSAVIRIDDYAASWILPYGQSLLWKHVLILPVLILGFLNGKASYAQSDHGFKIKRTRVRIESILLLFIFAATAWLGQQEPPHSIKDTLKASGSGKLSELIFPNLRDAYSDITFEPTVASITLFVIILLFTGLLIFVIKKTDDSMKIFYLGIGLSVSLFCSLLYSLTVFL